MCPLLTLLKKKHPLLNMYLKGVILEKPLIQYGTEKSSFVALFHNKVQNKMLSK